MKISRRLLYKPCLTEFPLKAHLTSLEGSMMHKCFCLLPAQLFPTAAKDPTSSGLGQISSMSCIAEHVRQWRLHIYQRVWWLLCHQTGF